MSYTPVVNIRNGKNDTAQIRIKIKSNENTNEGEKERERKIEREREWEIKIDRERGRDCVAKKKIRSECASHLTRAEFVTHKAHV